MGTDEKVVKDSDVEFGTGTARADEVAQEAHGTSPGVTASETDSMRYLGTKIVECMHGNLIFSTGNSANVQNLDSIAEIIPFTLSLPSGARGSAVITLVNIPEEPLRRMLEARYGSEIANTGIYNGVGIGDGKPVELSALLQFFPESGPLRELREKSILLTNSPYLPLLAAPVEARPFLTGATRSIEARLVQSTARCPDYFKPLTLRDILEYAKICGQVPKVAEYAKIYSGL